MPGMTSHRATERHATKTRRDHLWVLVIVAICALLEVWASWITIGSMTGFPMIGGKHGFSTDWTLAVTTETYWAYALYGWLAAAPGPRSRRFAKWSAIGVFTLSLIGQGASHLIAHGTKPPAILVVFVTSLPVIVLAAIAILIHMRHEDRAEAAEAEREAVEATELAKVRGQLSEALKASRVIQADLEASRAETAAETARAEVLAKKLASTAKPKTSRGSTQKQDRGTGTAAAGTAVPAASTERTFGELLRDARDYRDELAKAGERVSKEKLRLRFTVSSGRALEVLQALKEDERNDEPGEAPEASGAVG